MVPDQPWDGIAVAPILGRAGVQPEARFWKVYAGDFPCSCRWRRYGQAQPYERAVSTERGSRRHPARWYGWWRLVRHACMV
jgi:hypothetical protein